jgi:hypothetical protein
LEGAPKVVDRGFFCSNNLLTSLKGAPQTVGYDFVCCDNSKQFTEEEVCTVCDVKGKVYI